MSNSMELLIESLESRQMMAGDVSVSVNSGDLVIDGDDDNNELIIIGTGTDGEFALYGANGTSVNGQSAITVNGVDDDFRINLRDGDNKIGMSNVGVPDDLRIRTGNGNDDIALGNVVVQRNATIRTSGGDDNVFFRDGAVSNRINIVTSDGSDDVVLNEVRMGRASVNTGNGNDQLATVENVVDGQFNTNLGSGDDLAFQMLHVGNMRTNGGGGSDAGTFELVANRGFEFTGVTAQDSNFRIDAATGEITVNLELGVA